MGKHTKYISSGGLAFTERGDMRKLSRLSAKGWHLEAFAFLGYRLRKGEPRALEYVVDYHRVAPDEMDDYVGLFKAGGWTKVCSIGADIHIFSAVPGTKPIYSDKETNLEKYRRSVRNLQPLLLFPLVTILLFVIRYIANEFDAPRFLGQSLQVIGTLGIVLSVPILMTYAASRLRLRRAS
ncbi:DUF2812 domain-containing protein [Cohnella terricola]|uniref:DUF2812 domain-containing protein n=1 Tax=Cohnella terricola TaxID=1289167 RepID=A0A559JAG6_9BACL|nr:DUF2812 domain-containing protein [Cohnella terricola]TVX96878.1 DUF2812 domain-containing protein [Cohnella terricola]